MNLTNSKIYRSKIHDLIPGGCHTYSKGDDQFPLNAPAAIKRGKGSYLWDIDDNKYLDCSMGLTSVSLGHAYEPVLETVRKSLLDGVNFQRPSILELECAEKFLALIPQHDMIKFSKNGSTATTAAVKIARAATGREIVAFPSDHPFFSYDDWFIGHTPCNLGVPVQSSGLSLTYQSKDLSSLDKLFENNPGKIACVISEPERFDGIEEGYLQKIISICHKHGALFIQDEMVSGFKIDIPGAISKYNVAPDLATWGKGIANGFSFCALTGKKEYMELGGIRNEGQKKLFLISSTHGGETHALAASMATIDEFQKHDVIAHNHRIGKELIDKTKSLISKSGLSSFIDVVPCNWLPVFIFKDSTKQINNSFRTLFMQEMIKNGVLFQGIFSPCLSHSSEDVQFFSDAFEKSLSVYTKCLEGDISKYLIGDETKPVFRERI